MNKHLIVIVCFLTLSLMGCAYYFSSIHGYARSRWTDKLKEQLDKGMDINYRDKVGQTLLMAATDANRLPNVKLLVERGVDLNAQDNAGDTALMKAIRLKQYYYGKSTGSEDIILFLINNGADLNIANNRGQTALTEAARTGKTFILGHLCKNGAEIPDNNAMVIIEEPVFLSRDSHRKCRTCYSGKNYDMLYPEFYPNGKSVTLMLAKPGENNFSVVYNSRLRNTRSIGKEIPITFNAKSRAIYRIKGKTISPPGFVNNKGKWTAKLFEIMERCDQNGQVKYNEIFRFIKNP